MKVQRALVIAFVLWMLGTTAVYAESPVHTGCENYEEAPVGLFFAPNCSPSEAWWPITAPWKTSLEGEEIDDSISSIFVNEGWSIEVAENADGTGLVSCLNETKWDLHDDVWPDSDVFMNNTISHIAVFSNTVCGEEVEPPAEQEPTYCNDLSFAGVGLFELAACQQPGMAITSTLTGSLELGLMNTQASSLYVADGWSLLISNGDQEMCVFETKWDLSGDKWENGVSQDNSITQVVAFDDSNCGYDEVPAPEPQYCDTINLVGVTLFNLPACDSTGGYLNVFNPGKVMLHQLSGNITSVHVYGNWSARVSDGTNSACFSETKWDLGVDTWPETDIVIGDSITDVTVFQYPNCGQTEEPQPEKQYCDALSSSTVMFFDLASCEIPGASLTATKGFVHLEKSWSASSIYVGPGLSALVKNMHGEEVCVSGTKWYLALDKWPSGASQDNSITWAWVYENTTCTDENEPQEPQTYCDARDFEGVAFYDLKSCETPGASLVITDTGVVSLTTLSGHSSSVYIHEGWSIWVSNGSQGACLIGTKWDLSQDKWSDGTSQDNNITRAKVFDNGSCQEEEVPVDESTEIYLPQIQGPAPKTYCDSLTFTGAGLYAAKSCEQPGQAVTAQSESELRFTFAPASAYVSEGFSLFVFGVKDEQSCLTETKWDLTSDSWPNSDQKMTNIKGAIAYANTNCGAD